MIWVVKRKGKDLLLPYIYPQWFSMLIFRGQRVDVEILEGLDDEDRYF